MLFHVSRWPLCILFVLSVCLSCFVVDVFTFIGVCAHLALGLATGRVGDSFRLFLQTSGFKNLNLWPACNETAEQVKCQRIKFVPYFQLKTKSVAKTTSSWKLLVAIPKGCFKL